ncbi:MAG: putative signal transducing protein [Pirellulaceae bacterium]
MDKNDKLVTLTQVDDEANASIIVGALEKAGIKATCTGVFTAGFRAEAPGYVSVVVSEKDLVEAQRLLDTIEFQKSDIDWSKVDVGKPEE